MTGQRRVIARVLSDAADHPDVEELYRRATALDAHISIATVYRTVRLFEEKGILERRDFGGGRARYEPTEHGQHYHLIDVDSGRVIEFQDADARTPDAGDRRAPGLRHRLAAAGAVRPAARPGGGRPPGQRGPAHGPRRHAAPTKREQCRGSADTPCQRAAARRAPRMNADRRAHSEFAWRARRPARRRFPNCAPATSACASPSRPPRSMRCRRCATGSSIGEMGAPADADTAATAATATVRRGRRPSAGGRPRHGAGRARRGRHLSADPARGGGNGSAGSTPPTNTTSSRIIGLPGPHPGARPVLRRCRLPQPRRRCSCCGAASPPMCSITGST